MGGLGKPTPLPEVGPPGLDEEHLRALHDAGAYAPCLEAALARYGPELFGFICRCAPDHVDPEEVYGALCEALWRGVTGFEWRSTFRTWAYRIVHNVLQRACRTPAVRTVALSTTAHERIADHVRTTTHTWRKSETRDALSNLRRNLSTEERALLALRVDRGMSWREVALALAENELGEQDLSRTEQALRKRFERLKVKIRVLAREHGLVGP